MAQQAVDLQAAAAAAAANDNRGYQNTVSATELLFFSERAAWPSKPLICRQQGQQQKYSNGHD
jgi:hypothetical protein